MCYVHPSNSFCRPCIESGLGTRLERERKPHTEPAHLSRKMGKLMQVRLHVVQPVGGLGPLHEPARLPLPLLMLLLVLPVLRSDLPVSDKLGGLAAHKEVLLLLRATAIKEAEVIRRPGILCNCHQVPTCGESRGVRKSYVLCSLIRFNLYKLHLF